MADFWLGASPITWANAEPPSQTLPKIAEVGFLGAPAGYQAVERRVAHARQRAARASPIIVFNGLQ